MKATDTPRAPAAVRVLVCAALIGASTGASLAAKLGDEGLSLGSWLFYPSLFSGVVYDDNVNQTQTHQKSSWGIRVVPNLTALWSNGIHSSEIYGTVDARLYSTDQGSYVANVRAGFSHDYEAMRDLKFHFSGDYTRQNDFLNSGVGLGNDKPPPPNPFGINPSASPQTFNQFSGSASVRKEFNRLFVVLSGSLSRVDYDNLSSKRSSLDGTRSAATTRLGSLITPTLYAFAETTLDWRNYSATSLGSHGYRVTGGMGSEQFSLFSGEVYGGYQSQRRNESNVVDASGGVFGGRVTYVPLEYLTFTASVDQTLGVSTSDASRRSSFGATTEMTAAVLQAQYAMARYWWAAARVGFTATSYVGTSRHDRGWFAGGTLAYLFWRNWAVTLDFQHTNLDSDIPLNSYSRNVVSLGATYRY